MKTPDNQRRPKTTLNVRMYARARSLGLRKWQAAQWSGSQARSRKAMSNVAVRIEAQPEFDECMREAEDWALQVRLKKAQSQLQW